jgi:bifunctional non-homologous end joining protein LigD
METYGFQLCGEVIQDKRDFLESIEKRGDLAVVEKFNGYREMWYINDGKNEMFNRSGASHIHAVPHFQVDIPKLYGTVLDCEGLSKEGMHSKYSKRIFGSHAEHAIEVQRQVGNAYLIAFDILFHKGKDVRGLPLIYRRKHLLDAVNTLSYSGIDDVIIETICVAKKVDFYDEIVANNGEGVIVKDLNSPYVADDRNYWLKIKKDLTRDYYIIGFTPGNGKYSNAIGAVIYGIKDEDSGKMIELGRAGGMTDQVRYHMAANQDMYIGKLAEFGGKDINEKTGTLYHPKYIRLRDDI